MGREGQGSSGQERSLGHTHSAHTQRTHTHTIDMPSPLPSPPRWQQEYAPPPSSPPTCPLPPPTLTLITAVHPFSSPRPPTWWRHEYQNSGKPCMSSMRGLPGWRLGETVWILDPWMNPGSRQAGQGGGGGRQASYKITRKRMLLGEF